VQLVVRSTDFNRFQDKIRKGNVQLYYLGWNADYPDPENFFFLLDGNEGKVAKGGENASNYANPEFDRLFLRMKNMDNTPERLGIVRQMNRILHHDAPWVFGLHPKSYTLSHRWLKNRKPSDVGNNTLKYQRIDAAEPGDHLGRGAGDLHRVGHIAADAEHVVGSSQFGDCVVERGTVAVQQHDAAVVAKKPLADGAADATGTSGDDGNAGVWGCVHGVRGGCEGFRWLPQAAPLEG
jgi:hypothetical protein